MNGIEQYWYRSSPLHLILLPIAWLFGALSALRRLLYRIHVLKSFRLPVPVVIIGNITVGGTGKTPLTLAVAEHLKKSGYCPMIISRGYRGNRMQQAVTESSKATEVGDEPLLMAKRNICPVWVGRDRVSVARQALHLHPQCNVLLFDDGLQHYRLRRDYEIAVIDGVRRFGNGHLLPVGPLREPSSRLQTVDAVVVNGGEPSPDAKNQYAMHLSGNVFRNLRHPERTASAEQFAGLSLHAAAGIGNPARFFAHLASMGLSFIPHAFPDHHLFKESDLRFEPCDALLLTEKDAVKCKEFADERYWVLRVDAEVDSALLSHLLRKIAIHGCKTA